jgi:hypothetical protein
MPDKKKRLQIEAIASRESWNAEKPEKHVGFIADGSLVTSEGGASSLSRSTAIPASRRVPLLEPKRGKPGIFRIVGDGDGLAVDSGFTSYQSLNPRSSRREGSSDAASPSRPSDEASLPRATSSPSHLPASQFSRRTPPKPSAKPPSPSPSKVLEEGA